MGTATTVIMSGLAPANYRLLLVDPDHGPWLEYYADAPDLASAAAFAVTAGNTTALSATVGP